MMKIRWRSRTHYACGNCRATFKTEQELDAHHDPCCPIVKIEQEIALHNEQALRQLHYRQAEFGDKGFS